MLTWWCREEMPRLIQAPLLCLSSTEFNGSACIDSIISSLVAALQAHCMVEQLVETIAGAVKSLSSDRTCGRYRDFETVHPW